MHGGEILWKLQQASLTSALAGGTGTVSSAETALNSKMDANTIQQLRDQVFQQSQQMQDMRAEMRAFGTVKYPNGFTYTAGNNPFCGCGGLLGNA